MGEKLTGVLLSLLVILKVFGSTEAACSITGSTADCRNQGLTSVPQNLPTGITHLDLHITVILPSGLNAIVESGGRVTVDVNGTITITNVTAADAGLNVSGALADDQNGSAAAHGADTPQGVVDEEEYEIIPPFLPHNNVDDNQNGSAAVHGADSPQGVVDEEEYESVKDDPQSHKYENSHVTAAAEDTYSEATVEIIVDPDGGETTCAVTGFAAPETTSDYRCDFLDCFISLQTRLPTKGHFSLKDQLVHFLQDTVSGNK
ncbi:Hypp3021 [Branchiostoma lanceolatum]|uniref:Hypp3021 protein n=1 Tax=Branchiostoma lanceolatum TaxID=7740 RepID=A0A8J9ZVZ9_BRALA|nr:Hypp3021 [Branchiostoma lanceolatum]